MDTKDITLKQLFHLPPDWETKINGKTFVGIDFGTSTTVVSVAHVDDNTGKIISVNLEIEQEDFDGAMITDTLVPSVIAFIPPKRLLVGSGAYKLKGNPDFRTNGNLWHSFKMGLGVAMGPEWAEFSDSEYIHSPQDASKWFFRYLKTKIIKAVEEYGWSTDIQYAVSVPASFESNQRAALLQALSDAGINVNGKSLIDEPNAAFIGYVNPEELINNTPIKIKSGYTPKVLVFDFGAGTCDISILGISADFEGFHSSNLSISQFTELGGNDIDRLIAENYLVPKVLKKAGKKITDYHTEQREIIIQSLLGTAERLKIQASKAYDKYLMSDKEVRKMLLDSGDGVTSEESYVLHTDLGTLEENCFKLSFSDFEEALKKFFKPSFWGRLLSTNKAMNTVYGLLDSAITKAKINKGEIDYVLMIGGSSKNPFVQEKVKEYFPDAQMLLPVDMQALVSQGAALHSLMFNAFGTAIVRPITSEPIVVVTRDEQYFPIVPASTEVPISVDMEKGLMTPSTPIRQLEIPVCVGNNKKLLSNLIIKPNDGSMLPPNSPIELHFSINADKVVEISVKCAGIECARQMENPFANEFITPKEKKIREAQRATFESAAASPSKRPSRASLDALRRAYQDADNDYMAAETWEKTIGYYPDSSVYNAIGVLYHNSGNYTRAIEMYRKALESEPNNSYALSNLGHDLYILGDYQEARPVLEKSAELKPDSPYTHIKLYGLYKELGEKELAQKHGEQGYNIFHRKWSESSSLDECDYGWFISIARDLGKDLKEIEATRPKRKQEDMGYNKENLPEIKKGDGDEIPF